MTLRTCRRWFSAELEEAALTGARRLPPGFVDRLERVLAWAGPSLPILARTVADNMRAAGVYSREAHAEHFAQVALHLSNALRIFRRSAEAGSESRSPVADLQNGVVRLAAEQIDIDASIAHLRGALAAGRGAVVAAPHVCNYLLTLVRLAQEVPLVAYLRWSKDQRKRELKEAWCHAAGLHVIVEPPQAADPTSRAARCVEALRAGQALVMTPDIAQKADKGIPVRMLDRQAYLPAGPASIAMLAEAPLVPVFGQLVSHPPKGMTQDGRRSSAPVHVITCREPITVERRSRADGGRAESLRRATQEWADGFEAFLRAFPQAWFLWADNRWTRVFGGDPKYASAVEQLPPAERVKSQI